LEAVAEEKKRVGEDCLNLMWKFFFEGLEAFMTAKLREKKSRMKRMDCKLIT
jgi:hypothetical protein